MIEVEPIELPKCSCPYCRGHNFDVFNVGLINEFNLSREKIFALYMRGDLRWAFYCYDCEKPFNPSDKRK